VTEIVQAQNSYSDVISWTECFHAPKRVCDFVSALPPQRNKQRNHSKRKKTHLAALSPKSGIAGAQQWRDASAKLSRNNPRYVKIPSSKDVWLDCQLVTALGDNCWVRHPKRTPKEIHAAQFNIS